MNRPRFQSEDITGKVKSANLTATIGEQFVVPN
jgi:hypothetical protein